MAAESPWPRSFPLTDIATCALQSRAGVLTSDAPFAHLPDIHVIRP